MGGESSDCKNSNGTLRSSRSQPDDFGASVLDRKQILTETCGSLGGDRAGRKSEETVAWPPFGYSPRPQHGSHHERNDLRCAGSPGGSNDEEGAPERGLDFQLGRTTAPSNRSILSKSRFRSCRSIPVPLKKNRLWPRHMARHSFRLTPKSSVDFSFNSRTTDLRR